MTELTLSIEFSVARHGSFICNPRSQTVLSTKVGNKSAEIKIILKTAKEERISYSTGEKGSYGFCWGVVFKPKIDKKLTGFYRVV